MTFVALHNPVNEWPLKDTVNEETNVFLDLFMNFEKRIWIQIFHDST